jgi:hypothetical protein
MSFEDQQPTLEDLAAFLESLPPEEQQAAMVSLGLQQANQLPYTFGGDFQAELGPQAFEGAQYTGGYNLPNFTTKGAVDPRDQAQMAQSTTFAKNREGLLADNVFSAQAGPGAYAAGAFEPTTTYKGSVVDFPGERTLQALAQTGGWQGALAQRMLGVTDGRRRSPGEAWGEIKAILEADPAKLDKDVKALQDDIFNSLNSRQAGGGAGGTSAEVDQALLAEQGLGTTTTKTAPGPDIDWSQFDLGGMQSWANDRYMELLKDQPREGLFQDPQTGAFYNQAPEITPSAQSKWFADRGLTTPDKSYADQAYQEEVLNRQNPNRPMAIQQDQLLAAQGQAAQSQFAQQESAAGQVARLIEKELAKQQQGTSEFVTRQQAQNAPLPAPTYPERGGVAQGSRRKTAGSFPPELEQLDTVQPAIPRNQLEAQLAAGMSSLPEYSSGQPAPTVPRNVQGEPVQPGPGKDWAGAPLPSEQDLIDYYTKTFPTNPVQINLQTGESAPMFDFGAGKGGNEKVSNFISTLTQQGGGKAFDLNSGGQKGRVIPGAQVYPSTPANAAAFRAAANKAHTAYTDQYNQDWKRLYSGGDFGATLPQRFAMNNMAAQGRTPLNDEIMQRRLLLNALGLYQ